MTDAPFFIFFDSRSGSSFLARLLVDRAGAVIPPEANFVPRVLRKKFSRLGFRRNREFEEILVKDDKFHDWKVDMRRFHLYLVEVKPRTKTDYLNAIVGFYLSEAGCDATDMRKFGFKKGNYQYHHRAISEVYPDAKFICLIRDGRAVFNSKRKSIYSKTGEPFATDPEEAAREWVRCAENFETLLREYPERTRLVRYEDLIADSENEIQKLADFIGLKLKEIPGGGYQYEVPSRYGALHENVDKDPMRGKIDQWREELPEADRRKFEAIAGEKLSAFAY